MSNEEDMRLRGKLNFFMDEKILVHIKRRDGYFWRGIITSKKSEDVYYIEERMHGKMLLFIQDILEVDEFRGKKL